MTDQYFSSQWQVLEERQGTTTTAQYVWSPVYVDAMVERDVGGTRLYVQQDANYNVTAVVGYNPATQTWNAVERYVYDPYGTVTFYQDGWVNPSTTTRQGWIYLHQGGRYDAAVGLYNFRNRDYSPTLGRWMEEDPLGYGVGDANLYLYESSDPSILVDPSGSAGDRPPPSPRFPHNGPPKTVYPEDPKPLELPPMWAYVLVKCLGACFEQKDNARKAAYKAYDAGKAASAALGLKENSPKDRAFRHCVASGYLSIMVGCACAECMGTERENWQSTAQVPKQPELDREVGIANNRHGMKSAGCCFNADFHPGISPQEKRKIQDSANRVRVKSTLASVTESCKMKLEAKTLDFREVPKKP